MVIITLEPQKDGNLLTGLLRSDGSVDRYDERVRFVDGDRSNFEDPDNLDVYRIRQASVAKRKARIEARIDELQAQLIELEQTL